MGVALIIIYNHRFDQNIPKLEKIYAKRFSKIYHLVPFYDGDLPNVIPVFEKSFYFQAYVSVAWTYLKNKGIKQFVFIGDDLILNPEINERNFSQKLGIDIKDAFLPWFWGSLSDLPMEYPNFMPGLNAFYQKEHFKHHAFNWKETLPSYEFAKNCLEKHGFKTDKITWRNLKGYYHPFKYRHFKNRLRNFLKLAVTKKLNPPYPIVAGYADIFVIPAHDMDECCRVMDIFRNMRLWVEFAIPTTILLMCENVKTEKDISMKGLLPNEFFKSAERTDAPVDTGKAKLIFDKINTNNFEQLDELFDQHTLYIHPIKLSKVNL